METSMPRWFTAVFVAVLLLCSAVMAGSLFHQASMEKQIADVQINLEAVQGRLRKQQQEYDQIKAELPAVQAELDEIRPQAQAAYEREQALRQQRKDLRAENAALAEEIAVLTSELENDPVAAATVQAIAYLHDTLTMLHQVYQVSE